MSIIMFGNYFTFNGIRKKCQNCNKLLSFNLIGVLLFLISVFLFVIIGRFLGSLPLDFASNHVFDIPRNILGVIMFFSFFFAVAANYILDPFILDLLNVKLVKKKTG